MGNDINIRKIEMRDNAKLASIIRSSLAEFGADKQGTVFYDETTDNLFALFQQSGSTYLVAESNGEVLGGSGIFPSNGLPEKTCELVKMYLRPEARGKGLGKLLIGKCIGWAKELGYEQIYIETMPELRKAVRVYEKFGFEYLNRPLGNTGHFGCDVWMLKKF